MLEHVAIHRVEGGIVDVRLEDPLAQIVEHHDLGHPAQPAKGLLMQFGPDLRTGPEYQQAHRLAAVTEREDEQPGAPVLAGGHIADHGSTAVIDLHLLFMELVP